MMISERQLSGRIWTLAITAHGTGTHTAYVSRVSFFTFPQSRTVILHEETLKNHAGSSARSTRLIAQQSPCRLIRHAIQARV